MDDKMVFDTDDVNETARKIFEYFDVNQSCKVVGFETIQGGALVKKGGLVINRLQLLWNKHYGMLKPSGRSNGMKKKFRKKPNEIGGYDATKKFKFKWSEVTEYKVTIWRIQ